MSNRHIHRLAARPHRLIGEALQGLVVAEILSPGRRVLIASPWISDVPILDNRGGRFTALNSSWSTRVIRLSVVLRTLLERHTEVYLHCGPGGREKAFIDHLRNMARTDGTETRLHTRQSRHDPEKALDHEKAIAGDDWAVFGSMNLTYRGVEINGELVTVSTDPARVATITTELMSLFR
ncbi:phospholipase D-like domain-containing protein DpdK [Micromonospora sp. NBC_01699]|uniref:phospholipase D-like domain-containing protein DpdK n=1 Tax=Micromonospora sp. NBC_01699 TaxID=2975984 RepID=UPI002E2BA1C8|nr:phospholipase D-like domain-containing protein DpdK [Micromonospora sp. NBC_01699]